MSIADEGAQSFDGGRPLRVFHSNGPPPPIDVLALVDSRGGYWPRVGPDCWNCPGNEPHAWSEMAGSFVEAPRLPTADDVAAAVAADEAWRRQVPAVEGPGLISRCYIGYCPDGEFDPEASSLRVKLTERQPGQFTVRPYEPFLVNCWFRAHPDGHMLYPCTLEEYEAEDD